MSTDPIATVAMVTLDCADAKASGTFWSELLGGTLTEPGEGYAMVETDRVTLGFGATDDYAPPAWPDHGRKQFHLDLSVTDLDAARDRAVALGATLADPQPEGADGKWVVLLDPAGHPFCLAVWG